MKKQRTSLFRILILSLVMLVTVFIIAIAWFSSLTEATASGISVKAVSGLGLECSFDNNKYSPEIKREITSNFKFPLITGDGTNFFIPALDRSSGIPLTYSSSDKTSENPPGSWKEKRPAVAATYGSTTEGDYYVEDIWFQSDEQLDVYLTNQSTIKPLELDKESSELVRKSQYGDFTKDFIAGAARVAFFNFDEDGSNNSSISKDATPKDQSEFVWVPNEKYHLMTSENMTPIPDHTTGSGQGTFDPKDPLKTFGIKDSNNNVVSGYTAATDKYLGEINYKTQGNVVNSHQSVQMYKVDALDDTYYAAIDVQSTSQVDHGIVITNNKRDSYPGDYSDISSFDVTASKNGNECQFYYTINNTQIWVGAYFDEQGTVLSNKKVEKLTIRTDGQENDFFTENTYFQLLIAYSPNHKLENNQQLKVVGLVCYNKDKATASGEPTYGKYNGTAGIGPGDQIIPGYVIDYNEENGSTILIANNTSSLSETAFGLNVVETTTNAVKLTMKMNESNVLVPQNPLPTQLFTVVPVKDKAKTYKFKSISNGGFLDITGTSVILSADGSEFTIGGTKDTGPILQSGVHYLKYYNGEFIVSNSADNCGIQVYQGSSFGFEQNSTVLEDNYTYYIAGQTSLSAFGKATKTSTGYLLSNDLTAKPVVTLQKQGDGNYKAHIRVKIWVEGTDREAKIPLAGGKFSIHLAFQGVVKETTPTT